MTLRILLAAAALAAVPSHATTIVTFVGDPEQYTDVANERWEIKSTLDQLGAHIKRLGDRYIAPDDTLRVEVLDVDLAGWARWAGRGPDKVRVARGGADFPAMKVRYTLESRGRTRTAEETISDPGYMNHGSTLRASSEPLYHEKRMLDDWFRSTFSERAR
jgi:hypothetical protein